MHSAITATSTFLDPVALIGSFGTWALVGLLVVVFIESGVIFPLLPGDTLLFVAGMIAAGTAAAAKDGAPQVDFHIWQLLILIPIAAFLGAQVGYLIGRFIGTSMFKPNARLLKQRYLDEAHASFEQRGPAAVVIARFLPFIRTLMPLTAGGARMNYTVFTAYNLVGALAWGAGLPLLGYALGQFEIIQKLLEPIFIVIAVASVFPLLVEWRKRRRAANNASSGIAKRAAELQRVTARSVETSKTGHVYIDGTARTDSWPAHATACPEVHRPDIGVIYLRATFVRSTHSTKLRLRGADRWAI